MSIYSDFPINSNIWRVSNPSIVREKYHSIYSKLINEIKQKTGRSSEVLPSTRKNKKYMVYNGKNYSHFGDIRYEDYTKHKDVARRSRYLHRFDDVNKYDPYSK